MLIHSIIHKFIVDNSTLRGRNALIAVLFSRVKLEKDTPCVLTNDPVDRQANAERSIMTGLAEYDLADVYRSVHGYERSGYSWTNQWRECRTYRRFDHVFASSKLNPISFECRHDFLDKKLSDHAPIMAEFSP